MKVLFVADIHIKLGQKSVPVEWAKTRFRMLFEQLVMRANEYEVDAIILGGDIFDKHPTVQELELYFELIKLTEGYVVYIISGNHEADKKNTTFLSNLSQVTSALNPKAVIIDTMSTHQGIDFIPYNCLDEFKKNGWKGTKSTVLVSHFRAEIPPHVKPEIDLDLFNDWTHVLAGDLHSYTNSQRNILYPGSPVTTSFHRSEVDTGVLVYDTDLSDYKWITLNLPQLIRVTVKVGDPTPATSFHHTVYEVEGDINELGKLEDNALVDKRITKRSVDTALILDSSMTVEQEVREYLEYVLMLPEHTINQTLTEFSAHVK